MTVSPHVSRQLDEWIDGRLSPTDERHVEAHLEECARCRAEAGALRAVRDAVSGRDDGVELPVGLEGRILGLLDAEDAIARERAPSAAGTDLGTTRDNPRRAPARASRRPALRLLPLAAGLLLAVVVVYWVMIANRGSGPIAEAFTQFSELTGERETWRAAQVHGSRELEEHWRASDLGFPARVLDLSMSGYVLAGGRATRLGQRPAALAIYRGPDGVVTCWMFDGRDLREEQLPEAVDVHEANGFRFHVFERQGVTLVVWREGDVLCALSGRMGRDAVVELAHAKAMAPPLA